MRGIVRFCRLAIRPVSSNSRSGWPAPPKRDPRKQRRRRQAFRRGHNHQRCRRVEGEKGQSHRRPRLGFLTALTSYRLILSAGSGLRSGREVFRPRAPQSTGSLMARETPEAAKREQTRAIKATKRQPKRHNRRTSGFLERSSTSCLLAVGFVWLRWLL